MAYKPQAGPQMSAPNVIPMADIMLVLLIIFMVVTPMLQKTHQVDLAPTENPHEMKDADKDDAIVVAVTRDGSIFLGNTKVSKEDITGQVKDRISTRIDKTVYVKSDARAKYGDVVAVVDEIRSAGVDSSVCSPRKTRRKNRLLLRHPRIERRMVCLLRSFADSLGPRRIPPGAVSWPAETLYLRPTGDSLWGWM